MQKSFKYSLHLHINFRGGDKHIDTSSDSELDMPGSYGGSNVQNASKGVLSNSNMSSNLQHNLLIQQSLSNSQLGMLLHK